MPIVDPATGRAIAAPVGGWTVAGIGGYIVLRPWNSSAVSPSNPGTGGRRMDVTRWVVNSNNVLANVTSSGTQGVISRRLVAFDWSANIEAVWEYPVNPEQRLKLSGGNWHAGCQLVLYCGHPSNYPNGAAPRYYFAPSACLESLQVVDSSEGDDVVRYSMIFRGNSRLFLLPDELDACRQYLNAILEFGYTY